MPACSDGMGCDCGRRYTHRAIKHNIVLQGLLCWQVLPVLPCWQAVHCVALVQAVQCPSPMVLQLTQLPAAEQYSPSPHEPAVHVPAGREKWGEGRQDITTRAPFLQQPKHLLCWQMAPVQPGWHAVHRVALVQAVQRPMPIVLQLTQLPAAVQKRPAPHEPAVHKPVHNLGGVSILSAAACHCSGCTHLSRQYTECLRPQNDGCRHGQQSNVSFDLATKVLVCAPDRSCALQNQLHAASSVASPHQLCTPHPMCLQSVRDASVPVHFTFASQIGFVAAAGPNVPLAATTPRPE